MANVPVGSEYCLRCRPWLGSVRQRPRVSLYSNGIQHSDAASAPELYMVREPSDSYIGAVLPQSLR